MFLSICSGFSLTIFSLCLHSKVWCVCCVFSPNIFLPTWCGLCPFSQYPRFFRDLSVHGVRVCACVHHAVHTAAHQPKNGSLHTGRRRGGVFDMSFSPDIFLSVSLCILSHSVSVLSRPLDCVAYMCRLPRYLASVVVKCCVLSPNIHPPPSFSCACVLVFLSIYTRKHSRTATQAHKQTRPRTSNVQLSC